MSENAEAVAVAVLGLGEMGSALATTLLDAGHRVEPVAGQSSTADRQRGACGHDARGRRRRGRGGDRQCQGRCGGDGAAGAAASSLRGRTVVDLTDGSSEQSRTTGQLATEHGADYLHGQIMTIAPPSTM